MDKSKKSKCVAIVSLILLVVIILITCFMSKSDGGTEYKCDVKNFSLNTKILVTKDDNEVGTITGNIFTFVTDPLKMTYNDKVIAYADDSYHVIGQDDHAIMVNGEYQFTMQGKQDIIGNDYVIKNNEGEQIGKIHFNAISTSGTLYDNDKNIIATYSSPVFFNDYAVNIYSTKLNHNALLLLFASYYSDQHADKK